VSAAEDASSVDVDVLFGGTEIPDTDILMFSVEQDLDQPDMAVITLRNDLGTHNNARKHGETVEVRVAKGDGSDRQSIFKGEIIGIEPSYRAGGESKIVIRAFNKMHRMSRGKKSKTYQDKSDQDVVSAVCGNHGLQAQNGSTPKITHKHLYQHNQTDLEFVRVRAARLGFHVWCDDTKLYFDAPKIDQDSGIEIKLDKTAPYHMKAFTVRMSSAAVLKKVTVRGWDPKKKEEIVGMEQAGSSPLGGTHASAAAGTFGDGATFTVDHPIYSVEEAKAIAKARLADANLNYITGEAVCKGSAKYKLAIVVKVIVNADVADDRFNGKYLVAGCTHRYTHGTGGGGGYETVLRLWRDAEK
jgi:uncharacterized protein